MDKLPKDPAILVSAVNMLLCYNFSEDPKGLQERLRTAGFEYSETQKQFRPIGFDK